MRIANEINAYRKAHPKTLLEEAIKTVAPGVSESNYYAWEQRRRLAEATRKANGNGEERVHREVEIFPLMAFPERPAKAPGKGGRPPKPVVSAPDDNKVATLLRALADFIGR
jgi:hypothetical protein